MKIKKPEVERLLADRETPFTDFTVDESEGQPRAVFPRLKPEHSELLSDFLYPSLTFVDSIYRDALKVKDGEFGEYTFEAPQFRATFDPRSLVIVAKQASVSAGAPLKIKIPAIDARYLLMKWKFQCMRWEAMQSETQ